MRKIVLIFVIISAIVCLCSCGKSDGAKPNITINYNGKSVNLTSDVNGEAVIVTPPPTNKGSVVGDSAKLSIDDAVNNVENEVATVADNKTEDANVDAGVKADKTSTKYDKVDIDLAAMSNTMAYAEVYNIYTTIDEHKGEVIKAKGKFVRTSNPDTGQIYDICCIFDAAGCCAQQIEFDNTKVADKLAYEEEITIVGKLDMYFEGEVGYLILRDSEVL